MSKYEVIKEYLKENLKQIINPSGANILDVVARVGIPVALHGGQAVSAELPSEKASSLGGIGASLLGNIILWRTPIAAQILGQTGIYGLARLATKFALESKDEALKRLIAKEEFKISPLYERLKTRVKNLRE